MRGLHRLLVVLGWPIRVVLIVLIRLYRLLLRPLLGGSCRFHPTCSEYAEQAIRGAGAFRGSALALWRVVRCSPLSAGGVDLPPAQSGRVFLSDVIARRRCALAECDSTIQAGTEVAG